MKLLRSAVLLLLLVACNNLFGQTLKITSVGSADKFSGKILERQLVGKKLELTLYKDSAQVFVVPLHRTEKMKQVGTNQYMHTDSTDNNASASLLTIVKSNEQLLSIHLQLQYSDLQGDKKELSIIAKPD